jgi:hypothetical protein
MKFKGRAGEPEGSEPWAYAATHNTGAEATRKSTAAAKEYSGGEKVQRRAAA